MRSRFALPVLLAVPGLALALAGLVHPHTFSYESSDRWLKLHLVGLVFFPLLGLALAALVRGRNDPLAWVVRLSAYGYATFYSALDVISGIGTAYVTRELGPGVPRPSEVSLLFRIGDDVGAIGSFSLVACGVAVLVDQVRRHGVGGAPALLLPVGAWFVHTDHIFSPIGVLGMALIGLATGALARNLPETRWPWGATFEKVSAS